eukprot:9738835-Alexandrium_andersonii.AAC.1
MHPSGEARAGQETECIDVDEYRATPEVEMNTAGSDAGSDPAEDRELARKLKQFLHPTGGRRRTLQLSMPPAPKKTHKKKRPTAA